MKTKEPPCTERYARWCERSANQLMISLLLDCKFTDYALNLEIAENNIYNKDKICLLKIIISETEIKGGKQR